MRVLTDSQEFLSVKLNAKSAAGNVSNVENATLESSDPTILAVSDNGDGSFKVSTTGVVGTAELIAKGDSKIGDGENIITALESIQVVPGEAVVMGLDLGEATDKPVA